MRWRLLFLLWITTATANAQHCPWDCSGLLLVKTEVPRENIYKLFPVLVNEKKEVIIDTIYGTGKPTYDTCNLLYYDDFLVNRIKRIQLHNWYAHDTVYHFANGYYVIKVNFCKYKNKKLFLRLTGGDSSGFLYKYVEVAGAALIHLHDYSLEINGRKTGAIREAAKGAIVEMTCEKWMLREADCK
jgi:hypothetical protein